MRHGFTLIELLVVVAIIAILAAMLFPAFSVTTVFRCEGFSWCQSPKEMSQGSGPAAMSKPSANLSREQLNAWADDATQRLIDVFWNEGQWRFHKFSDRTGWSDFWWTAQVWDSLMDAVERTGGKKSRWFDMVAKVFEGQSKHTPTFLNPFYDDMAWWTLAMLRAYKITGEPRYLERAQFLWKAIQDGWSDDLGGGIWWNIERKSEKNACINCPAAIIGARMYQITGDQAHLNMALKLYKWVKSNLLSPDGLVYDHVRRDGSVVRWVFTYNQGTFIGAAVELYRITKDKAYLEDARRVARATMTLMVDSNGILTERGSGDGGGFKGILIRYLCELAKVDPDPKPYREFILRHAQSAWQHARNSQGLFCSSWSGPPEEGRIEVLTHASAVMLFNLAAMLEAAETSSQTKAEGE
ncbi:MAG: prepilin-type N-terminal cleavage/methylation domain-containing protein [Armatimonadetes bacterium]|nr:prepilin-type N-terminal cleavage/methylation domain-containing protein [Armatimonadota bacterium]